MGTRRRRIIGRAVCLALTLCAGCTGWWLGRRSASKAPPTAGAPRKAATRALSPESFAGDWLPVSDMVAHENSVVLTVSGGTVSGRSRATGARFDMHLQGEALVGDCIEPDRRTPVRMEMTPGHDRLVISLMPPDSEPDIAVCVRVNALAYAGQKRRPSGNVSAGEAVASVRSLPEVADWLKHFTGPLAQRACVEVANDEGEVYTVHVYEDVPGPPGEGHNATLGWFEVHKQTGKVTKVEL